MVFLGAAMCALIAWGFYLWLSGGLFSDSKFTKEPSRLGRRGSRPPTVDCMAYTKNLGRRHHLRLGGRDNFLDSGIYDIVYDNLGGLSLRIFQESQKRRR